MPAPASSPEMLLILDFDRDDQDRCWAEANEVLGFGADSEDRIGQGRYCGFPVAEDGEEGFEADAIIRQELKGWPSSFRNPVVMIFLNLSEEERASLETKLRSEYPLNFHVLAA